MSVRVIVVCDVCQAEQLLKGVSGPLNESEWERELGFYGWWVRTDAFHDVCPNHPRPVAS